jgi:hypothetical protein
MKRFILPVLLLAALVAPHAQASEGISVLSGLKPMNSGDMSSHHGGSSSSFSWMSNESNINQTNGNNVMGDVGFTGGVANINISNNAGVTTTIMNTGNQVNIAQSNNLNVYLH